MKWMLCCYAGMTTSILAQKLEEEGASRGIDLKVDAVPIAEAESLVSDEISAIILGPHVRFMKDQIERVAGSIPVYVIPPQDFGMMNSKGVVDAVLALIG